MNILLCSLSANKYWSGLVEGYYLPRALTYFYYVSKSLRKNESFHLEEWRREWILFSNKWQAASETYPVKAEGNSIAISRAFYEKYFGWDNFSMFFQNKHGMTISVLCLFLLPMLKGFSWSLSVVSVLQWDPLWTLNVLSLCQRISLLYWTPFGCLRFSQWKLVFSLRKIVLLVV